jgi:drug/metabolite transporter (DMT)-like permease
VSWRTWVVFATLGILWGSAWTITPLLPVPALLAGAARFLVAGAVLLSVAALAVRVRRRDRSDVFPFRASVLLGVTMVGLPYALAVWAKGDVSAGLVAVAYSAMPLAAMFLSRQGNTSLLFAMAGGMGGVAFLVDQGISYSSTQIGGLCLLGVGVLLGAFSLNYGKTRIQTGSILMSSAIQCAVASLVLACLSGTTGELRTPQWSASWTRQSVFVLTALAAVEGSLAIPLLYWLLGKIESWQAAALQWLATLAAVAEAAWFLREKPTLEMCVGGAVTLGAIVLLMGRTSNTETVTLQITR